MVSTGACAQEKDTHGGNIASRSSAELQHVPHKKRSNSAIKNRHDGNGKPHRKVGEVGNEQVGVLDRLECSLEATWQGIKGRGLD